MQELLVLAGGSVIHDVRVRQRQAAEVRARRLAGGGRRFRRGRGCDRERARRALARAGWPPCGAVPPAAGGFAGAGGAGAELTRVARIDPLSTEGSRRRYSQHRSDWREPEPGGVVRIELSCFDPAEDLLLVGPVLRMAGVAVARATGVRAKEGVAVRWVDRV